MDRAFQRTRILTNHLLLSTPAQTACLTSNDCFNYSPPELSENYAFDVNEMRKLMDGHDVEERDRLFGLIIQSRLFNPRVRGGKVFVSPDYNQSMEQQREMTWKRIEYLLERGVFKGWMTGEGEDVEMKRFACFEVLGLFDHSISIKLGVHFFLWGGAIQFFGTKHHHDKWLRDTENYKVKGCFSMTELGHGSNVRGIETVTTYDSKTGEFVINTPCESAQKYWIGGAAKHATHTIVFSQLNINGNNEGVHALIAQIRDADGNVCPNIRIADCGHKIGLNGVDNGRIWFDNVRVPRENLLNSVADVSPDGKYLSSIKDPDQRFAAFLSPLTAGRVNIAVNAVYQSKVGLSIAIRYALTRRAFSLKPNEPEVLLLDYPSHQRRLLPLLAKIYAMSFGANYLKMLYVKRTPQSNKTIHVVSSSFKATITWSNMQILQECREACGGQGLKTENRVGHLKAEHDVQSTFEGDNNILMQQVSKALFAEYMAAQKRNKVFKGLGLEHMNKPCPVIPSQLTSTTLRCSQFQMDALCLRERELLNRFVADVSQYLAKGESKEQAFNMSYQVAEDLGKAFSDRAIFQTFVEAEATLASGSLKDVLGMVRSLYALNCLEDITYLRYGFLSVDNGVAVSREITKLCTELRPHALGLVSSFGIPDSFLSPIAFNWVDANSWSSVQH
ncbi:Acyl-coenzyme A oxidase 3, peroxisomal [Hibiscus syriacus]|uniref:Acyl-coenzyme A oxidase n=1 Tax=Hibiscus syriacus TaxID=106335 RepID=A0A6A2XZB9_HIBSY|nr:acyl-coenzyme A oxidase 3, peroxisomal-like [Hibiscus syriacus]KAE8662197.1 Acyl-coenzyme A oxidase 3, peroxisomal [Hibiscus syriacus]